MAMGQKLTYQLLGSALAFLLMGSCLIAPLSAHATEGSGSSLKITEIYPNGPGASESGTEFIELTNMSNTVVDLGSYQIKIKDKPTKIMNLSGTISPQSYKAFITPFSLVNSGETVQLTHSVLGTIEEISYTSGALEDQSWSYFPSGWELAPITKDLINQRYQTEVPEEPDPDSEIVDQCPATPEIDSSVPPGYEINESGICVAIIVTPLPELQKCFIEISEISAQPNFDGQEFIELYNPSNIPVSLKLCKVKVNTSGEKILPDTMLHQGGYYVYTVSSGTIKNSAGSVTLYQSDGTTYQYTYPTTEANQTVNFSSGSFEGKISSQPTPGQPNEQTEIAANENSALVDTLADCGVGRYRSSETNRCRNIESLQSTLTPCAADQERNPATNRCRKISAAEASLKACDPGQERNPETNRCRKIDTDDGLKPCAADQERNSETNRCRKKATLVSGTPLEASAKPAAINPFKYKVPIIIFILMAAIGYGIYEYRTDLSIRYQKVRESIFRFKQ